MTGRVGIVTGTGTGVGKTVATAALAARALGHGQRTAVVKPVQTGTSNGDSDAREIHRLTGLEVHEHTTLPDPLAPDTAARRAGIEIPRVGEHADRIRRLARCHDLVLVEGAGGLLVRLDTHGGTLLDLADHLADPLAGGTPPDVFFVVVAAAGLGTLNHTELTVRALRERGHEPAGIIIGSWPERPGLAERCNLEDLPRVTGVPLLAAIPAGTGALDRTRFGPAARAWLPPTGGRDADAAG